MGIRSRTQGPNFFEFFTQQASKLVEGVEILSHIYAAYPEERIALRDQLHGVEHQGDELNHEIFKRISSSFITPFDREDLQSLASHLDDCMDFIDEAGDMLVVYGIAGIPEQIAHLLDEQIAVLVHCSSPPWTCAITGSRSTASKMRVTWRTAAL